MRAGLGGPLLRVLESGSPGRRHGLRLRRDLFSGRPRTRVVAHRLQAARNWMLLSFGEPERLVLRAAIAEIGLAKASVVAPAIERFGEWKTWLQLALQCSTAVLQARVSEALEALPRGREPSPPGERFRRAVLGAMPDIEAMELVERFFEVGAKVVESPHPVGIFLAGCRECLSEWEV